MNATGGGGAIVNTASIHAKVPSKGSAAYCTAKAGWRCSPAAPAMEMGPWDPRNHGDRSRGYVETPPTECAKVSADPGGLHRVDPDGPGRRGDDIANAALFLVSDDVSWISGETLYVDGAESTSGYPDLMKLAGGAV